MEFAPEFERNEGFIRFPDDSKLETEMGFVHEVRKLHPAKANLHLTKALIEYTSQPGQTVMDITAGSGSILMAGKLGRQVIAIELSPQYIGWIEQSAQQMGIDALILQGDCRDYLPLTCNSIVFSPPYAGAMKITNTGISRREAERGSSWQYAANVGDEYSSNPKNLGTLSNFLYNQAMEKVYRQCYQSLVPGGFLSLLIKDRMRDQKREDLGLRAVQLMTAAGFTLHRWEQWLPPGSIFSKIHKYHGLQVVEEEHILISQKVE